MSSTGTKTTLVDFSWPSGAKTVQITGDWNQWSTKEDLEIKQDGSFHKLVPLPENSKVLFKFIVDGNWTTKDSSPTETDSSNNLNNVVQVGPAPPTEEEKKQDPASGIKEAADQDLRNNIPEQVSEVSHSAAPALAGIGGAIGGAMALVTGSDPTRGNPIEVNQKATNGDAPATTRNLPSHQELSEIGLNQNPALAGATAISGAAFSAQSAVAPGSTSTQSIPSKDLSTLQTPSALNPSSTPAGATLAKLGSPVTSEAKQTSTDAAPSSSAAPTADQIKKQMANPSAAATPVVASVLPVSEKKLEGSAPSQTKQSPSAEEIKKTMASPKASEGPVSGTKSDAPSSSANGISGTSTSQNIPVVPVPVVAPKDQSSSATKSAITQPASNQPSATSQQAAIQPEVPAKDAKRTSKSSKKEESKIIPSAAAPISSSITAPTSTSDSKKSLPQTPATPEKSKVKDGSQTVKEKRGSKFGTLGSSSKRKSNNDLAAIAKGEQGRNSVSQDVASGKPLNGVAESGSGSGNGNASSNVGAPPTTPNKNRDRKVSLFGKIKHALSPNSSPSK